MKPDKLLTPKNANGNILAVGELLIDFIPKEIGTRLADGGTLLKTASGSSGIFACAVAGFAKKSGSAAFVGRIGSDSLSLFVNGVMEEQGVDISHCVTSDEGQIGLAFIEYTDAGRNYQYYRQGSVGSRFCEADVDTAFIENAFIVHYSGMLLELSDSMRRACIKVASVAKKGGALVSFDPNIRKELLKDDGAKKRLIDAISSADVITPTLDEARFITGEKSIRDILVALHKMGPRLVALTCDKNGAVLSDGDEILWAKGIDCPVVDPTGAGDTFAAALAYCLSQNFSLEKTALFCNCAGTCVVKKRGAIGMALPSLEEVLALMDENSDIVIPLPSGDFCL